MFNYKNVLNIILFFISLSISISCDSVESNETGTVQILYNGIEKGEYGKAASFLLINDSTEIIEFWGYDEKSPLYSSEVLTDTGWTYLMWNWCGTGASPVKFSPGDRIKFITPLPNIDCTWRVILGVKVAESEEYYTVKSKEIVYSIH